MVAGVTNLQRERDSVWWGSVDMMDNLWSETSI